MATKPTDTKKPAAPATKGKPDRADVPANASSKPVKKVLTPAVEEESRAAPAAKPKLTPAGEADARSSAAEKPAAPGAFSPQKSAAATASVKDPASSPPSAKAVPGGAASPSVKPREPAAEAPMPTASVPPSPLGAQAETSEPFAGSARSGAVYDAEPSPRKESIAPAVPPAPELKAEAQPKAEPSVVEARPAADEPPESIAAPAQPHSVHIEEPLPPEEPAPPPEEHHAPVCHRPNLFIVQVAPEMAPVAKVGGLADVVFGLTRELAIRGNHVEIILPKYDNMRYDHIYNLHVDYQDLWVPWYEGAIHCTVYFGMVYDRKCFFIEPHSNDNFFNRGSIYGFQDDVMRYAFFSRAAIEFMWKANKHPDIIHCHDWQTALLPVYLYEFYQRLGMSHPRVCLTIHNFQHQGVTGAELLRATGLHYPERYLDYNRLRDNHHQNALNVLKGGIVYSNFVTTVSPRYAFETKDQGQGFGLEPTLHTHQIKYGGVVNGIDYDVWNPEIDGQIPVRYGLDTIEDKYENKRALRHRLMLADNEKPIVAFIGRLDPQKGLDLVRHAIFYAMERGAQFVLLGSSPYHNINSDFWGLKHMLNDSPDCHLEIGFNEELSHLIYAGADMMLVPSRFEPCGLTQLVSLRYGTVPIVRSVGGLADTVFDKDYSDRPLDERNGYVFNNYDHPGLESALGRAVACYYNHPDHFRELMKNAMRCDYSWNRPGQDYLNIYDYIREK